MATTKHRKSVMAHRFSNVPSVEIPRSSFDRSHGYKTTFDSGYLVPFLVDEALPGDTFNCKVTGFARLATPIKPVMDNMFMETFFFAVPYRLVWDNWQKFNGEQANPGDSTDFVIPKFTTTSADDVQEGSVHDYMGIPPRVNNLQFSALYARAYNLIWNEWFRDQNLQNSAVVDKGDSAGNLSDYTILRRGKRHDYFTSCLPWPQKGDPVSIPLGSTAPVRSSGSGTIFMVPDGGSSSGINSRDVANGGNIRINAPTTEGATLRWGAETNLQTDLSAATAATINSLRQGFQIQRMLERDARGGTRYIEIILSHFGVRSPDQRLQRPEYLGGGSTHINITSVPQTTPTGVVQDVTPQGNLAGFGTVGFQNHGFNKSFTEHCIIIGLVNVRADLTYQQGLNRMWSRSTRYDFFWPSLAHLGEQAVLNKEIFAQGGTSSTDPDNLVFGYQERYAEYRYKPSLITGKFRSTDPQPLDVWHLSQKFENLPTLSDQFIQDTPPIKRVIAVQNEPEFLFDSFISMRCARPMPLYGVPGLIDHF